MSVNVLIIDADEQERQQVKKVLSSFAFDLDLKEAVSGDQAMSEVSGTAFDCIFMNPNLPDQDCREVLKRAQGSPSLVFLTKHESERKAIQRLSLQEMDVLDCSLLDEQVIRNVINNAFSRQKLLGQISDLLNRDALTSLSNRTAFLEVLRKTISHSKRTGNPFCLIILDIDHFKDINETMGHDFGDELLKEVALSLDKNTRELDLIARIGNDEFGILATDIMDSEIAAVFARRVINILTQPYWIKEHKVYVSMSMGISIFPDDGDKPEILLSHSEYALQRAKQEGKNRYCFYDERVNLQAIERVQVENDLRLAFDLEQFELYYQPKIALTDNSVVGVEALVRWNHPKKGVVSPDEFIPILEKNRDIIRLGGWVFEGACKQLQSWKREKHKIVPISVNLSIHQLEDLSFVSRVKETLNQYDVPPEYIELEITESMLMQEVERITKSLNILRDLGMKVSIDDFGTGYSSLSYLRKLPVDTLKIDKSFIDELENCDDQQLTHAIISMGKIMNLNIIAEGVETKEQLEVLKKIGCDEVQGYYFSKPKPIKEFEKWLKNYKPAKSKKAKRTK
jgi:diguanylate cyclase (GGDEF)-like protein